jgi:hypothetical protein
MKPPSCDPAQIIKVAIVFFLSLSGWLGASTATQAANSCSKECLEYQRACRQAHSQAACKTDYDICMKHCKVK